MSVAGRAKLAGLHSAFRPAVELLVTICEEYGVPLTITSGLRTVQEQAQLYRDLKAREQREGKPYPVAKPGYSAHNYGLAVDLMGGSSFSSPEHRWVIGVGVAIGMHTVRNDPPHLEHPQWREILRQLQRSAT